MQRQSRGGFTLTELLIVVGIMILLSTLTMVAFSSRNTDKTRSAARITQSVFLGAKDRAMNAKEPRGLRFIRDYRNADGTINQNIATGFVYVQPVQHDAYPAGSIQLERLDADGDKQADSNDVLVVHGASTGKTTVDWDFVWQKFQSVGKIDINGQKRDIGQIRIPAGTGQWYAFYIENSGPYALSSGNEYLKLLVPYTASPAINPAPAVPAFPSTNKGTNSADIQFAYDVVPFHQPTPLPAGVVIDLAHSNIGAAVLAQYPNIDIPFTPRGAVAGNLSGVGALHFCLRPEQDAALGLEVYDPNVTGESLILSVNPQTGLVQTYEFDLRDVRNNATGAAGADGIPDDLFQYAKTGKGAGR